MIEKTATELKKRRLSMQRLIWSAGRQGGRGVKRAFDICCSLLLLIVLAPIYLLTALAIYLDDPGPVFFRQKRVGKNGRVFDFYKFRSMVIDAEKLKKSLESQNESSEGVIFKVRADPRITQVGRVIRKYSIDELPQLFNVLRGDMSLVGPRPAIPAEVAQYSLEQRKRLHVVPGITCIWQISGRSDIPFTGQVQLDMKYISTRSIWQDLMILLKTVPAVITGKGAY